MYSRFPSSEPVGFPTARVFREMVDAASDVALAELSSAEKEGLRIVVDETTLPTDDRGEPLLGSYRSLSDRADEFVGDELREFTDPPQVGRFAITLYLRSFRAMYGDEPYDVQAEIDETLENELEHHQDRLRGEPLDKESEAVQADRYGKAQLGELGRESASLIADFARFVRLTWPLWIVAVVGIVLLFASR